MKVVAYHASNQPIEGAFNNRSVSTNSWAMGQMEVARRGIFFSNNPEYAAEYGSVVKGYTLNLQNPALITRDLAYDFSDTLDPFGEDRNLWIWSRNIVHGWQLFDDELGERFVDWLISEGYDSAIFDEVLQTDSGEVEGKTYVVFEPNQIEISESRAKQILEALWDRGSAAEALKWLEPLANKWGYAIAIVGSIHNKGESDHDLDLKFSVIDPYSDHDFEAFMEEIFDRDCSIVCWEDSHYGEMCVLRLTDGRDIDIFFEENEHKWK